jgi:hypothetical protein
MRRLWAVRLQLHAWAARRTALSRQSESVLSVSGGTTLFISIYNPFTFHSADSGGWIQARTSERGGPTMAHGPVILIEYSILYI